MIHLGLVLFLKAHLLENDSIALGAIRAFKEFGLSVPEDISIVGFDDISAAAYSDPPLTTMRVNCKDMGGYAVRLLRNRIDSKHSAIIKIQINPELVVRDSACRFHD